MAGLQVGGEAHLTARPKTGGRCSKAPGRSTPNATGRTRSRPGRVLPFPKAAERADIGPNRQRYYDALEEMECEGAIEWDESARYARGAKHYVITRRGLGGAG